MLRLGLIGTDGGAVNGHSCGVVKSINNGGMDAVVTALMGNDAEETEALASLCNPKAKVFTDIDAFLENCDAVMVMHRNGKYHKEYAVAALHAGKPVFVDKPLACTVEDAKEIIAVAKKNNAVLHSGSSVGNAPVLQKIKAFMKEKGEINTAYISFPLTNKPEFGGIHFYTHHILAEYAAVFTQPIKAVTAMEVNGNIVVLADCEDFPVMFNYAAGYDSLHFGIYFKDGSNIFENFGGYSHDQQLVEFIEAAKAKVPTDNYEEQLLPVKVSVAIEKSLQSGLRVTV